MVKEEKVSENFFKLFFPPDNNVNYNDVRITDVGLYSISDYKSADKISDIIKNKLGVDIQITDATANVGGNTISFAKYFNEVNSVEIVDLHCDIIKHNINAYNLKNKVKVHCDDYLEIYDKLKQDVIFIDAPWGGKDYKKKEVVDLYLGDKSIADIVNSIINKTKLIVLKVPKNFNFKKFNAITKLNNYETYVFRRDNNSVKFLIVLISS